MSEPITFDAVAMATARGHVRLPLPFDPRDIWGRRPRHYVTGQIAGSPFTGSVGFQGGGAFLLLSKDFRARAGIEPGQTLHVALTETTKP